MIRPPSARALLILVTLASFAGCTPNPEPESPPQSVNALWDTHWVSADKTTGADAPTIEFIRDRANGFTGCNRWFAQVESREGDHFRFIAVGSTRRACEPEAMEIEAGFLTVIEQTASARTEDGVLVLYDAGGQPLARFDPQR